MTTTTMERVWSELLREDKVIYTVQLELTIKELMVDESPMPINRAISRISILPPAGMVIEDGDYTLRFPFDGKQEQHSSARERRKALEWQGSLINFTDRTSH